MYTERVPLAAHFWTIAPTLAARWSPPAEPPAEPFRLELPDPLLGTLTLTGRLHAPAGASTLIVALHGLAGSSASSYLSALAVAATERGFACLRLNLRGADLATPDFYHAGLTADLTTVLGAASLARFHRVALVGFSLGGHVALRWAAEQGREGDPRVAAVATVCAPLDLDRGATALDSAGATLYRGYLLRGLRALADEVERRRPAALAMPRQERSRLRTLRAWDGAVVAPRWGFASAEDYYARASAGPLLGRIERRTWIIVAEHDPMVPSSTMTEALRGVSSSTEVTRTPRGGHVGMPPALDLGQGGARGLGNQLLSWIERIL